MTEIELLDHCAELTEQRDAAFELIAELASNVEATAAAAYARVRQIGVTAAVYEQAGSIQRRRSH